MKTLNLKIGLLVSVMALGLAGCARSAGTPAHSANSSQGGVADKSGASAPESDFAPSDDNASAPAPAATGDESAAESGPREASAAPQAAPRAGSGAAPRTRSEAKKSSALDAEAERPGLGTVFGETRTSRVSSAPFERNKPNSPFAVTTVSYNDRTGVEAMLTRGANGATLADFRSESVSAARGMVSVRLVDDNGMPLPTMASGGRSFVMGEHGQHYSIELQNLTGNRFEAVVTVDGLDVIDGRPGSVTKRGYLLQPFATVEIDGFRQSMDEVAAFRFGSVRNSYAGRKGDDRNVGVIGVAFFEERGASFPWTEREIERRERANPFPGGFAQPPIAR